MDAVREFLHIGERAFYVWSAYCVAMVVRVANVFVPVLRARMKRQP